MIADCCLSPTSANVTHCSEERFAARAPGLALGLALAVRHAGLAEAPASRVCPKGCAAGAPLTLEGPARTMRGAPVTALRHLYGFRRARRVGHGLVVVLAGAAAGYGGDRRRPVTGAAVCGSRRAVGLASEGRGESCRPVTARSPGEPRPPTAGRPGRSFPINCSRPSSLFTAKAVRPGAPKVRP
jgi:hypothetical protein